MIVTTSIICLALNVYHEARGEPVDGQFAVAAVTLNRVMDPRFPDDLCDVVYEPDQFSWTADPAPILEPEAFALAMEIAFEAKPDPVLGTHYHTTSITPYWAPSKVLSGQIGNHRFYTWN